MPGSRSYPNVTIWSECAITASSNCLPSRQIGRLIPLFDANKLDLTVKRVNAPFGDLCVNKATGFRVCIREIDDVIRITNLNIKEIADKLICYK